MGFRGSRVQIPPSRFRLLHGGARGKSARGAFATRPAVWSNPAVRFRIDDTGPGQANVDEDFPTAASEYFGSMVESYDSLIRRAVPRYDEMTARLLDYTPREAESVLELGCGTGNLSLGLARRYPAASLTLV